MVAYGQTRKSELVGAVGTIDSKTIDKLPITTMEEAFAGQVAGLDIRQNTSVPGGSPEILIRGIGSISAGNQPLFVVDGFIYGNTNASNNNPLASIPPGDIESISVLKDAASAALYGSRASNGVILITTKSGREGKTTITFDSFVGVQSVMERSKPQVLNARELAQFNREKFLDSFFDQNGRFPEDNEIPNNIPNPDNYGEGTNWFDELTGPAVMQNYNLSASGGNEYVSYFISANYFDQDGVVENTGFKRYALRTNIDAKLSEKLNFGVRLNLSQTVSENNGGTDPGEGSFSISGTVFTSFWLDPSAPLNDANGNLARVAQGDLTTSFQNNPVYEQRVKENVTTTNQTILNTFLEFKPIEGLNIRPSFGVNSIANRNNRFAPELLGGGFQPGIEFANSDFAYRENFRWQTENTIEYKREIGEHSFGVLGGFTAAAQESLGQEIGANNIIEDQFEEPNSQNVLLTAPNDPNIPAYNIESFPEDGENTLISYLSRVNYNYDDKYIFTGAIRWDASSRFGPDERWASFTSAAVGWRISNEDFFQNLGGISSVINNLKLEASYGEIGNNRIGDFRWQGQAPTDRNFYVFGAGFDPSLDEPVIAGSQARGRSITELPNTTLTWEETVERSVGLDIGLFSNRIVLEADYYIRETSQLINEEPLPRVSGFRGVVGNLGDPENRGLELSLSTINIEKDDWNWSTNFNIAINRNKVLRLGRKQQGSFSGICCEWCSLHNYKGGRADWTVLWITILGSLFARRFR